MLRMRGAGQADGGDDARQVAADQRDVRRPRWRRRCRCRWRCRRRPAARAGASLMPSPTMADDLALALAGAATSAALSLGQDLGQDAVDADLAGDGLRRCARLSPVIMTTSMPMLAQRGDGVRGVGLDGVGDGDEPGGLAVDGDEASRVLPVAGELGGCSSSRRRSRCPAVQQARLPTAPAAVDDCLDPLAGDGLEVRWLGAARRRAPGAARRWPAPADARSRAPAEAARRSSSLRRRVRPADDVGEAGLPCGDGAGLVEHDGVELVARSPAPRPLRIRMPCSAPLPVPTMIGGRRRQAQARTGRR